jgi:hypothetical protein
VVSRRIRRRPTSRARAPSRPPAAVPVSPVLPAGPVPPAGPVLQVSPVRVSPVQVRRVQVLPRAATPAGTSRRTASRASPRAVSTRPRRPATPAATAPTPAPAQHPAARQPEVPTRPASAAPSHRQVACRLLACHRQAACRPPAAERPTACPQPTPAGAAATTQHPVTLRLLLVVPHRPAARVASPAPGLLRRPDPCRLRLPAGGLGPTPALSSRRTPGRAHPVVVGSSRVGRTVRRAVSRTGSTRRFRSLSRRARGVGASRGSSPRVC